jgi:two-component system nitrogen regulation response regulator NtrX
MTVNVLIIDDEKDIRMMIGDILQDNQYNVLEADNADNALKIIKENEQIDLVILDIWLEGSQMDGIEILKKIKRKNKTIPVIMISGHGNIETAVEAIKIGAYDYIEKPFQYDRLLLVVSRALEASELKKENIQLKRQNGKEEEIIGISSEIANIKSIIERIAPSGSRVFITGAPGVGKEVVARCIHQNQEEQICLLFPLTVRLWILIESKMSSLVKKLYPALKSEFLKLLTAGLFCSMKYSICRLELKVRYLECFKNKLL